ncbi:DUF5946 family protein [Roseovarius arcticus]|uniref:DUF5946 family protein n=1 Tax=Roseovarius arcticus TaxID=2547404 RepID=UPI001110DCD1|nr:DUF5946 family protein [Roseovarius arcticus]
MIKCVGCGSKLERIAGPTHRYMLSSPACFAKYDEVLAHEYSDPALMRTHRLTVDAFAIQHPGDGTTRQAIQSVGLHLARLGIQVNHLRRLEEANNIMLSLGQYKAELVFLAPPAEFTMTVADVAKFAGTPEHVDAVKAWARSAWADWSQHHDYIIGWAEHHIAA